MKFDEYSIRTANLTKSDVKMVDVGDIPIGEHSSTIKVLKVLKTTEATTSDIKFFLRSIGDIAGLVVGFYANAAIDKSLVPGHASFAPLTVIDEDEPDPGDANLKAIDHGDYVHLDFSTAISDRGYTGVIRLAVLFDYT